MTRLLIFFKKRKNRDILLYISAGLALLLPISAYFLDSQGGEGWDTLIFILSPLCFISVIFAVVLLLVNCSISISKKIKDSKDR